MPSTSPRSFLETIQGVVRPAEPTSSADKPFRIAVIDSSYTTGDPLVTFEGETTMSGKPYPYISTYTPRANDRVVLAPLGTSYIIVGAIDGAPAVDTENITDFVRVTRGTDGTETAFAARVTGDNSHRLIIRTDGQLRWGPGGSSAQDTILYRSAADQLKTDDSLVVGTNLTVNGSTTLTGPVTLPGGITNTVQTYTPNVYGHGTAGWSRRRGYHYSLGGKMRWVLCHFEVSAAGSGTSVFQFDLPTAPNRDSAAIRQTIPVHAEGINSSGLLANGNAVVFAGDTGNTIARIRVSKNGANNADDNITGADLLTGAFITVEGWYWEL